MMKKLNYQIKFTMIGCDVVIGDGICGVYNGDIWWCTGDILCGWVCCGDVFDTDVLCILFPCDDKILTWWCMACKFLRSRRKIKNHYSLYLYF